MRRAATPFRATGSSPAPTRFAFARRATTLEGPASADVAAGRTAQLDLKLRKTQDLAAQLTNGEWFMSWPGTTEMKNGLLNCTQCHTLERVAVSKHTADEWKKVLERMGRYAQGSTPERPQLRPNEHGGGVSNPILQQSMGGREGEDPVIEGSRRRRGGVPRDDQSQLRTDVAVSAEDVSPSDRQGNARDHHRVRPAATGNAAARRGRRFATA